MRVLFLVVALAIATGCAGSITSDGLRVAWGDSSIGTGCDVEGNCGDVVEGGSLSAGLAGLFSKVLNAAISVVPFADAPQPDTLTVRIERDTTGG